MLQETILQQKVERNKLIQIDYQPRCYHEQVEKYLKSNLMKLITGPRRAGKSVFSLLLLRGKRFAYLNFDDDKLLKEFDEEHIMQVLKEVYSDYDYLLLDEPQNLSNWDLWVSKLYRRGYNLVITGSNSNLLSSEMASLLTGRYLSIEILPFSLRETLEYRKSNFNPALPEDKADFMLQVEDYFHYGGYPEIINNRDITESYLKTLFDSIIMKDIVRRYKVRKVEELYQFATYMISIFTSPFTYSSITEELGLSSKTTVQKFCTYLKNCYLFFYLPRYNHKLKLMQKAPQKVYIVDNGFLSSSAFQISENKGRLLENLVLLEFIRRKYEIGKNLFYYRNQSDKEVDFVVRENNIVRQLVQVCWDMSNPKTQKREIGSLMACAKDFPNGELFVITWNEQKEITMNAKIIHVIPYYKWCLSYSRN
ncbi:ATP-binding protein [Segatella maculosa]|uniref:ATP-binding protein n=1 Tax=Segatella maculosa TaxID=439703 RepID=UPI0024905D87|nr:ATP-binding protein [Segatella maculosa]